jgi:hypothetical protein
MVVDRAHRAFERASRLREQAGQRRDQAWLLEDLSRALYLGLSGCQIWSTARHGASDLPPDIQEQVLAAGVAIGVIDQMAAAERDAADDLFERSQEQLNRVVRASKERA